MATTPKPGHAALGRFTSANKEARDRYHADTARREGASRILNPNEVSGEYDAGRLLSTTLGGIERMLTIEDLHTFRKNVKALGKKFKGGITAKSVIDMSLKVDRDRSNKEITMAVPVQLYAGRVHFMTNAGPKSDVTRHHVHIELLNYSAAISSPAKPAELVKMMATGPLKLDCDCGRHTFWYRFIATSGNFNAGRPENGFPKIRNPNLAGVACKHVLRVMQQLSSPGVRKQLEKMVESGRKGVTPTRTVVSKAEAKALADQQAAQTGWKRNQVESNAERQARLAQQRGVQTVVQRSMVKAKAIAPKMVDAAKKKFIAQAQKLAAMGVLTAKQLAAMLAKLK